MKNDKDEDVADFAGAPHVGEGDAGSAEVGLFGRGAAGVDVGPGAAAFEEAFVVGLKAGFEFFGPLGLEHHAGLAGFAVEEREGGDAGAHAVVELGLHGGRGRGDARIKRVERVVSAVAQAAEEVHAALGDGVLELAAGESVDLD